MALFVVVVVVVVLVGKAKKRDVGNQPHVVNVPRFRELIPSKWKVA